LFFVEPRGVAGLLQHDSAADNGRNCGAFHFSTSKRSIPAF
jgi:hypothetical protein